MTTDSWELPSYVAGSVSDMSDWEYLRVPRPDQPAGQNARVFDLDYTREMKSRPPESKMSPNHPQYQHEAELMREHALAEIEPYDPAKHLPPAELYDQDDIDALHEAGFQPHDRNVWFRQFPGDEAGSGHYLVHSPGFKQGDRLRPWHLTTDLESTTGRNFRALRGLNGALKNVRMASVFPDWTRIGAATPGQGSAEDWLAKNTPESFENDPRDEARNWMNQNAHLYNEWHPSGSDYTYPDYGDAAGQSFHGEGEGRSHVLPGSSYEPEDEPRSPGWSPQDYDDEDENYEPPEHEQHLADLGFNWEHRGDPDTTPVGIYQGGQYVKHQHDPEGNHIATHMMYRDPNGRSDMQWHLEHSPADMPDFAESHTTHQFPHDAISYYHQNAENALLPSRGYEPHRGPSGAITHWTRIDTSPTGDEYHHEISHQPSSGDSYHQGFLGQTFGDHMNSTYAPHGTRNQSVEPDLADVVREHDRIGRGLHPGGAQDYRATRSELLSDPTVARLGEPSHVSDNFYRDGKVGSAHWHFPHPEGGPHHVNAEATYDWDKGGYNFKYTHDGNWLAATHNAVPAGAPVHVPGRQTSLSLGIDHPFNINDYRRPSG